MDIKAIIARANEFMSKDDITKPILEEAVKEATEQARSVVEHRMNELKEVVAGMKEIDSQFKMSPFSDIFLKGKLVNVASIRAGNFYGDNVYVSLAINRQDHIDVGRLEIKKDKEYIALVVVIEKE